MNRFLTFLALGLSVGFASQAEPLSPQQALDRLDKSSVAKFAHGLDFSAPKLIHTMQTPAGDAALYVFSPRGGNGGYLIVSADDLAAPLLGYNGQGQFSSETLPPAMTWWLNEYARRIDWAKANGVKTLDAPAPPAGRRDIDPLISTSWDQGEPYNIYCPIVNGTRAYTGCVATSMSQIMNYFQYPEVGTGSISYNDEASGKRLTWDFTAHPFEWNEMLPTYRNNQWTEQQANAVANLMKSTGASVKMSYAQDSSGALGVYTALALVKYFKYDPNLYYMLRNYVSATEWDNLVYDNLDKVGPVLYGGGSMLGGGHSFIVDGYDSETGLYHLNWGWSEMSDGYFALDALNPMSLGAGGGGGGGYNFDQDGVFGIQKPTGEPTVQRDVYMTQFGTLKGTLDDNNILSFTLVDDQDGAWINYSPYQIESVMGVSIRMEGANDSIVCQLNSKPQRLPPGYGLFPENYKCNVDLNQLDLPDGNYKFTIVSKQTNIEGQADKWIPVRQLHGFNNWIDVVKNGSQYAISSERGKFFTVDDIEIVSGLYFGCLAKVYYKLTNNNDIEISRGIAPVLYRGTTAYFLGESKLVTIGAHQTIEGEMITDLYSMTNDPFGISADTEVYVSLYEETSGRILTDECFYPDVMHPNPGLPDINVVDFSIEGYDEASKMIPDPSDMHVTATIELNKGRVAYSLCSAVLSQFDASGNAQILDFFGEPAFLSEPGETFSLDTHYNFKAAVPGETYNMMLCYIVGNSLNPVLNPGLSANLRKIQITFRIPDGSGVEAIPETGTTAADEWFNLQGQRVDYDKAPAGIYLHRKGNTTSKVLKK